MSNRKLLLFALLVFIAHQEVSLQLYHLLELILLHFLAPIQIALLELTLISQEQQFLAPIYVHKGVIVHQGALEVLYAPLVLIHLQLALLYALLVQ